jgi:hypothetical protein
MTRRQSIARFIAGRAARIILAGSEPESPPENPAAQVNDIILSNLVVREDASNGLVGYLYALGTPAAVTFSITVDADGIFAIQNGNELHKVDSFGTGADYSITIKATETVGGAEYSEAFTIDVIPTEDAEGDSGIGGGSGSGDVVVPDPNDPGSDTDPYVEPPVEVVTEVAAKVSGKTGGTSVFLKDWGVPVAGRVYVMKYSADWTGMSAQGRYAAVGFGFKQGNSFHMVGLRGNGAASTTMLGSRLYGDWRKSKQFTITNDGAATHGTKNGPNWLRLTIGGDGTTYTLESSADGATWAAEITDAAPAPFTDATDATQFGPAAYFYEEDKGPFVISISEFWQKPVFTVDPVITGTPTEGETLSCSDGTVVGAGVTITQQWKRGGANISSATAATYVLQAADIGATITCTKTATNDGGSTSATSAGVGPIVAAFSGVLDSTGLSPTGAYSSVRRLRAGYTGPLLRVARASDSTEQDIGYDADGDLDVSALTTFCAGTNGFVADLYDQSGNGRHFEVSTPVSFGPQIVSSGAVITTINSLPTMDFGAANTSRFLQATATATPSDLFSATGFTQVLLCRGTAGPSVGQSYQGYGIVGANSTSIASLSFFNRGGTEQLEAYCTDGSTRAAAADIATYPKTAVFGARFLSGALRAFNNGNSNGAATGIGSITLASGSTYAWLGRSNGSSYHRGPICEAFFFNTGLSNADLNAIGGNVATLGGETWTTVAW